MRKNLLGAPVDKKVKKDLGVPKLLRKDWDVFKGEVTKISREARIEHVTSPYRITTDYRNNYDSIKWS